ncbi:hypothetical protein [Hafnia psychrotolerans]
MNKSNFWPQSGSDHQIPHLVAMFRGKTKVQNHQLENLQPGAYQARLGFIPTIAGYPFSCRNRAMESDVEIITFHFYNSLQRNFFQRTDTADSAVSAGPFTRINSLQTVE